MEMPLGGKQLWFDAATRKLPERFSTLCTVTKEDEYNNQVGVVKILLWIVVIPSFAYRTLRIDFNHSRLNYYTEIDAIMLCGRTVSMRNMQKLLTPVRQRIESQKEDTTSGPITCKLRTLKFQPNCKENYADKLHDFINNDLSQFLTDNHVESNQQLCTTTTPPICLKDLPVGQPISFISYALRLMCKVFLLVWNPVENTQLPGPKVTLPDRPSVASFLQDFHWPPALLRAKPETLLASSWLGTVVYAGASCDGA